MGDVTPFPLHGAAGSRRAAFNRLPREVRTAVLRWDDPRGQFGLQSIQ